jgi:pimeloyl-ACP methyl ester carboxylesterase
MTRERDLSKWEFQFTYSSEQEYLATRLESGVHSIRIGDQFIDLYVENRGSDVTLVNFNAAAPRSSTTVPVLLGHGLTRNTGINLIAVADPTMSMAGLDVTVTWYLGNKDIGKLPPILAPLIQHALDSIKTKRTILFGASGGGYAAVLYGQYFPDSIVFGVNPRLDLNALPKAATEKYLTAAHDNTDPANLPEGKDFLPGKLSQLYKDFLPFDLCIYQNLGDKHFLNHQLIPLATDLAEDPRLFTKVEWIRPGHVVIPGSRLRHLVAHLASEESQKDAIIKAGFTPTVLNSKDTKAARPYHQLKTWK